MEYISDAQAKQMILEVGRRMYQGGFVAANDGNISCKVGDNEIWATPTGVSKGLRSWTRQRRCKMWPTCPPESNALCWVGTLWKKCLTWTSSKTQSSKSPKNTFPVPHE